MTRETRWAGTFSALVTTALGARDPECAVKLLADQVAKDTAFTGPPFDPQVCARKLGLEVVDADVEAEGVLAGNYHGRSGVILMGTPTRGSWGRRNFTIAHEIGHHVIRQQIWRKFPGREINDHDEEEEERLCNVFAAELLMPIEILQQDLSKLCSNRGVPWPHDILELTRKYKVSLQALLSRIAWICRGHITAIIWDDQFMYLGPEWATPFRFRRAVLCNHGADLVRKTLASQCSNDGSIELLVDGCYETLQSTADVLSDPSKILSLGTASWDDLRKRLDSAALCVGEGT